MANTVHNPSIPYIGAIPGGLHDGLQIIVSGTPEHHHNGFLISLQAGPSIDPRNDCAFVFNPRFNENQVVRNSLQAGSWGAEERHGGFPLHRGQHCEVTINVKPHHYSVSLNGRHFCDYNHRIQKHRVTHLTVEQGIRVTSIRFEGHGGGRQGHRGAGGIGAALGHFAGAILNEFSNSHQPHQSPYPGGASGYPSPAGAPMYNPPVPFVQTMGGLYPNKMIFITGIPHPSASRLTINLQCGNDIIAFHFDVRFRFGNDRNVIVRNTKKNGWGPEERALPSGCFPFQPDMYFEIIILVELYCFKVAVNNQHLLEFNHRVQPLNRIDTLRIDGDLRLTQYPGGASGYQSPAGAPMYNPPVPFVLTMGGLYPNKIIFIAGIPHPSASRLTINLQCGNDIIAFHFDVRFRFGNGRNVIVRNTKKNDWGPEERALPSGCFPFQPDKHFEMIILVEQYCYKVAVNNRHLLEFNHRIRPLNRIDTLRIDGDLRLTQVRFQG